MGVGGIHIQSRQRRTRRHALLRFLLAFGRGLGMVVAVLVLGCGPGLVGGLVFVYGTALFTHVDTVTAIVLALIGGGVFQAAAIFAYAEIGGD